MESPTPRRAACCAWVRNAQPCGRPVRRWAQLLMQLCIAQWGTTRAWRCARLITCSGGLRRALTGWTASPRGARASASSPLALAPTRTRGATYPLHAFLSPQPPPSSPPLTPHSAPSTVRLQAAPSLSRPLAHGFARISYTPAPPFLATTDSGSRPALGTHPGNGLRMPIS